MRLIDADELLKRLPTEEINSRLAVVYMPTIDPVRHRRWIKMSDADGIFYGCSECGEWHKETSKYCPNCGAKMDGGDYGTMAE